MAICTFFLSSLSTVVSTDDDGSLLWRRPARRPLAATHGPVSPPLHHRICPSAPRPSHRTSPRLRPLSLPPWPRRRQRRPVHVLCIPRLPRQASPPRRHDSRRFRSRPPSPPLQGPRMGPLRRRPRRPLLPHLRRHRVRHRLGRLFRRRPRRRDGHRRPRSPNGHRSNNPLHASHHPPLIHRRLDHKHRHFCPLSQRTPQYHLHQFSYLPRPQTLLHVLRLLN